MMKNGKIYAILKTGGGADDNGNPIQPITTLSEPIDCHIRANRYSNMGVVNGNTFVSASYEVFIESRGSFSSERVRLETDTGDVLGDFSVLQIERLPLVGRIRIVV